MSPKSALALSFLAVSGWACAQTAPPPAAQSAQTLTLDDVVKLAKAGVSEELVIARIKRNGRPFDLNSAEIVELRQMGVTEAEMKYLIDPSQPYAGPPPPPAPPPQAAPAAAAAPVTVAPPPSPAKPPSDPLVLKLPPEVGLYWLNAGQSVQLELKPVVTSKAGGGGGKIKVPFKKNHAIGSLAGAAAKVKIPTGPIAIYARTQTPIEDLVLVEVSTEDNHRELDFGEKADKPTFPPKSVRQFESKDVGQGVIRLNLPSLPAGEYLFIILGSGEEKKGTLGKGWEFGVQ